jgi:hypothetical protein
MGSMQQLEIATLNSLAAQISELAAKMTKQLEADNVPPVTLEADSPINYERLPGDLFMTRQLLEDALKDMWIISQGPSSSVFNYVHMAIPDAACLNILNQFDFWKAVPVDGEATFDDIAKYTKLPLEVVDRVIDHAVTMRFFAKISPTATSIKHTSRSAALAKDPGLSALVQTVLDETGPPMLLLPEALRRYSQGKPEITKDMKETAFKLCYSGGAWGDYENSWDFIEKDGEGEKKGWRQRNFVKFMAYIKDLFQTESIVLDAIDWNAAGDATVVDVSILKNSFTSPLTPTSSAAQPATTTPSSQPDSPTSRSSSKTSPKSPPSSIKSSPPTSDPAYPSAHTTSSTHSLYRQISTSSSGSCTTGLMPSQSRFCKRYALHSSPARGFSSSTTWASRNRVRKSCRGVSKALALRPISG